MPSSAATSPVVIPGTLHVVVATLTYRRPDDLAAVVPQLVAQAAASREAASVLVVDNDPDGGAATTVAGLDGGVAYLHAPVPGIAAARNAALEAAHDADLLVFIDDDERPADGWLDRLVETWRATAAAAVVGPVVSRFPAEADPWITAGRFFVRRRLRTGTETDVAATNNLLLDLVWLRRKEIRFDERFGLTGGSDTLFTRQVHASGGRIVWCDEAVVTDVVPHERLTREWVLHRAYRSGNSWALTSLALHPEGSKTPVRLRLVGRGLLRVVLGGGATAVGVVTRMTTLHARGRRTLARGLGMCAGAFGSAYAEYRRD